MLILSGQNPESEFLSKVVMGPNRTGEEGEQNVAESFNGIGS